MTSPCRSQKLGVLLTSSASTSCASTVDPCSLAIESNLRAKVATCFHLFGRSLANSRNYWAVSPELSSSSLFPLPDLLPVEVVRAPQLSSALRGPRGEHVARRPWHRDMVHLEPTSGSTPLPAPQNSVRSRESLGLRRVHRAHRAHRAEYATNSAHGHPAPWQEPAPQSPSRLRPQAMGGEWHVGLTSL